MAVIEYKLSKPLAQRVDKGEDLIPEGRREMCRRVWVDKLQPRRSETFIC